jgi:hypothetical protein
VKIAPPDLQELVAAAGGFHRITPEMWAAFDQAMEEYQRQRRAALAHNEGDPALDVLARAGPIERVRPDQHCVSCGAQAHFGYRTKIGTLRWFCAQHRLAKCWSDARR